MFKIGPGLCQVDTGAVPSTVQVCMICLDTDEELFPLTKHKLEEAYENVTGHPIYNHANLKPSLCIQCAPRLKKFNRFRDECLRARSLMLESATKHNFITKQHIKTIKPLNGTNCNLVSTTLGPDHCDLYIKYTDKDIKTELLDAIDNVLVKTEDNYCSISIDEDTKVINQQMNNIDDEFVLLKEECIINDDGIKKEPQDSFTDYIAPGTDNIIKNESNTFVHNYYTEAFTTEYDLDSHTNIHQTGAGDGVSSQMCTPHVGSNSVPSHSAQMAENGETIAASMFSPQHSAGWPRILVAPLSAGVETNENNTTQTFEECNTNPQNKDNRDKSKKSHTEQKPFSCNVCEYKCKHKSTLAIHMRTHSDEKPYSCNLCDYKCAQNSYLVLHTKTHTGEKPFSCNLCDYKCSRNSQLVLHTRVHSGEKPYSCNLCKYRTGRRSSLVKHVRTHTGEKPYSCKLCEYKCVSNSNLMLHMRTHTGEKPYSCDLCDYKSSRNSALVLHKRIHTGEKPYACHMCDYKCVSNSMLVLHIRTHTGERPYSCKLCDQKCSSNSNLVHHMRTHTGEKPYSCELCDHKCGSHSNLMMHMKTHNRRKS